MITQAWRRNYVAISEHRFDLRRADITSLPFPAEAFTTVVTVNCLPFWPSVPAGLAELRRVLAPHGRAVIAVRLR